MIKQINRRFRAGFAAIAVFALAAGGVTGPGTETRTEAPRDATTDHVVVISIDGLRPDAIEEFDAETLQRLMREGAYSLKAQTILPSKTLPSHTSMLTGVPPAVHGITFNSRQTDAHGVVEVPTVFAVAKDAGYHTAAFFSKAKFHHLAQPGSLDYWQGPGSNISHWMATKTVPDAVRYLEHERPNLIFIHIGEPDYAGHSIGWMSFAYGWAVKRADGAVDTILEAADDAYGRGNYTVIVTADHGGHDRNHGSDDPRDMTIPWIAWGKGVRPGGPLNAPIRTMDTAATALWLLGVAAPPQWVGRPVSSAFTPATQVAGDAPADEEAPTPGAAAAVAVADTAAVAVADTAADTAASGPAPTAH
ncbi:MAG TPA: ectonucleotide pyrophosphatase/phosphodiesterase [Longimicrobiales bacterium]